MPPDGTANYASGTSLPPGQGGQPQQQPPQNRQYSFAPWQSDDRKDAYSLRNVADVLGNRGYPYLPNDMMMGTQGGGGPQLEKPLMKYRSAFLPYVSQLFQLPFNRTASGGLALLMSVTSQIKLYQTGVGELGTVNGVWWTQTSADTTLEKQGAPVYERNSFWALGMTTRLRGMVRRGGTPGTPLPTDPIVSNGQLDDGDGSYYAQAASIAANNIAFVFSYQGDSCPRFMGAIAANGDRGQVVGAGRVSLSLPIGPYTRWTRPAVFGAKDEFAKLEGTLAQSVDLEIDPIGGNAIPDGFGDVSLLVDMCLFGVRVCGNPDDDCP